LWIKVDSYTYCREDPAGGEQPLEIGVGTSFWRVKVHEEGCIGLGQVMGLNVTRRMEVMGKGPRKDNDNGETS
jgi:hypothetical protein